MKAIQVYLLSGLSANLVEYGRLRGWPLARLDRRRLITGICAPSEATVSPINVADESNVIQLDIM